MAESQSLISESKALEQKANELETLKTSNMLIEEKMKDDQKMVAELDTKRKSEDKSIAENESRLAWESKAIQDGELLLKSQIKAAAEAEKAKEVQDSSKAQALVSQTEAEKKLKEIEAKLSADAEKDAKVRAE